MMIRGNNRQRIFYGDDYFSYFLDIVSQSTKKFDHKIIAYCFMNNHAHLLIYIHSSSLSAVMQKINYRCTRWAVTNRSVLGIYFKVDINHFMLVMMNISLICAIHSF